MPTVPDHVIRFWRSLDHLFSRVEPMWWGAVVSDGRFPAIWDTNYARVDVAAEDLRATDVDEALIPVLRAAGVDTYHVVSFHPDESSSLLSDLTGRGHRLGWDLVMELRGPPPAPGTTIVEEVPEDDELWGRVGDSLAFFGTRDEDAVDQLRRIERDVLAPGGKRWFGVRDEMGALQSLGALLVIDDVGYVDNVATFPRWRGKGLASAVTARIAVEASAAGAAHVILLADPDEASVVAMYERLGFHACGNVASTRGPVEPRVEDQEPGGGR